MMSDIITVSAVCVLNLKLKLFFPLRVQDTVNYVPRVAIYDIEGTIMGKPVRNNSAYDGLVD